MNEVDASVARMHRVYGLALFAVLNVLACSGKHPSDDDSDNAGVANQGSGAVSASGGSAGSAAAGGSGGRSSTSVTGGTGGAKPGCAAGYVACGASCVDVDFDSNNCGTCSHRCASGETCRTGACTTTASGTGGSTGGTGGTGGSGATGGSGGTGGTVTSCTDPTYPTYCPALGGVAAGCWTTGTVCATVTSCSGQEHSCTDAKQVYDCATSRCITKNSIDCEIAGPPHAVCSCTSYMTSSSATPSYTGSSAASCVSNPDVGCGGDDVLGEICCADSGYPDNGATCSCYYNTTIWGCWGDAGVCTCSYQSQNAISSNEQAGIASSTCDTTPAKDGTPWFCWVDRATCYCKAGITAVPSNFAMDDTTIVSDCTQPPAGATPSYATCPSGTTSVKACSAVPPPTCEESTCSDSQCVGDLCCTYSCKCGSCQQTCND